MQQQSTDRNLFELFSKIRQNNHLREKDKPNWLSYLNLSMRHFSLGQTLLHSFVKKDKSASIHLSFRDLWSLADEHGFLEDPVLDTVLNDCFQNHKILDLLKQVFLMQLKILILVRPLQPLLKTTKMHTLLSRT